MDICLKNHLMEITRTHLCIKVLDVIGTLNDSLTELFDKGYWDNIEQIRAIETVSDDVRKLYDYINKWGYAQEEKGKNETFER